MSDLNWLHHQMREAAKEVEKWAPWEQNLLRDEVARAIVRPEQENEAKVEAPIERSIR